MRQHNENYLWIKAYKQDKLKLMLLGRFVLFFFFCRILLSIYLYAPSILFVFYIEK